MSYSLKKTAACIQVEPCRAQEFYKPDIGLSGILNFAPRPDFLNKSQAKGLHLRSFDIGLPRTLHRYA